MLRTCNWPESAWQKVVLETNAFKKKFIGKPHADQFHIGRGLT
jgi:hypothetical protein